MLINKKIYYPEYEKLLGNDFLLHCENINTSNEPISLDYSTQASAVYSSNIEGNSIDLNSFMNSKLSKKKISPAKEIEEIENLISAYNFAQKNALNEENFLWCHKLLSTTLLIKSKRGKYREEKVGVFDNSGLVYLAVEPELVHEKMETLFRDLKTLLEKEMNIEETFFFASLIHLIIVHIHPFMDGNGRIARLIEKWFLSQKLGTKYWKIPSEKFYKEHQSEYYKNINLGVNFYELDYNKCIPFLLMLPNSLK